MRRETQNTTLLQYMPRAPRVVLSISTGEHQRSRLPRSCSCQGRCLGRQDGWDFNGWRRKGGRREGGDGVSKGFEVGP